MATDQLPIEPSGLLHRDDGYYTWTKGREPERGPGGVFCVPFFTETDVRAAIAADHARAVPARWEWRLRPSEDPGNPWTEWRKCTEEQAKEILASNTTRHEVRALYTRPPAPEQPAEPYHLSLAEQGALNRALRRSFKVLDPAPGQPADLSGQAATAAGEREAFEAHMSDGGKWPKAVERNSRGEYVLASAASGWSTWRAAWAAARASLSTPASGEGWMPAKQAPESPEMGEGWSVTVSRHGVMELTISDEHYCGGRELDEGLIVGAAQHLLAFVGYGLPPCSFDPDDAPTSPTEPAAEGGA